MNYDPDQAYLREHVSIGGLQPSRSLMARALETEQSVSAIPALQQGSHEVVTAWHALRKAARAMVQAVEDAQGGAKR